MQEFQSHLERLRQENAELEEKVIEMSVYKQEVQALRDEIVKLQVIISMTFKLILLIRSKFCLSRHRRK